MTCALDVHNRHGMTRTVDAIIFDMDGLLVDSEPLWRDAEMETFHALGMALTPQDCCLTTGLRIDEVVAYWRQRRPWNGATNEDVAARIMDGVVTRIRTQAQPMPGVGHALHVAASLGVPRALASSSSKAVIAAVMGRLNLQFDVVASGEDEVRGKPDPAIYLTAARRLGVSAARCVALEDSHNGLMAAKAAGMRCVVVPDRETPRARFSSADVVLESLQQLTRQHLSPAP